MYGAACIAIEDELLFHPIRLVASKLNQQQEEVGMPAVSACAQPVGRFLPSPLDAIRSDSCGLHSMLTCHSVATIAISAATVAISADLRLPHHYLGTILQCC
jgi:hypothetical protein